MNPISLLNPWVLLGLLAAALAIAVSSEQFGESRQENADAAKLLAQERLTEAANEKRRERIAELVVDQTNRDAARDLELMEAQRRVVTVVKYITKKVPEYVTPTADAACVITAGFVRVHDLAASNKTTEADASAPAETGGLSVDRPSGVALSAVAATVTDNYGTCHELETQVVGWKKYHVDVEAWAVKVNAIISEAP